MKLHPLCTLFPRMEGAELDALAEDIRANGLRSPIVVHDGMILDGGNRHAACLKAGIEPDYITFDGDNIVSFVLSVNLHRRHMTSAMQAAIVASAQNWGMAETHGGDRKSSRVLTGALVTTKDRAAQSGASISTQRRADAVAKADPELAKQVGLGQVKLQTAVTAVAPQVASRPPQQDPEDSPPANDGPDTNELLSQLEETQADNESMARVFEANDKVVAALAEAKRYRELNKVLDSRIVGLMNEKNAAISHAKSWQRKAEKFEKEITALKLAADVGF